MLTEALVCSAMPSKKKSKARREPTDGELSSYVIVIVTSLYFHV